MKPQFYSKYQLWIETEAVFTTTEKNNELKRKRLIFFKIRSVFEKSHDMNMYLPREKLIMNKTVIFFKKFQRWNCFYQDRNE